MLVTIPQVESTTPQMLVIIPQVEPTAPQMLVTIPQVESTIPQMLVSIPKMECYTNYIYKLFRNQLCQSFNHNANNFGKVSKNKTNQYS